jgi:hypothetical protein
MGTHAPQLTPGAKGFVIRLFPEDGLSLNIGVKDLSVTGSGLVQFAAPPEFLDVNFGGDPSNLKDPLRVQTRPEAVEAQNFTTDVLLTPLNYPREDSYLVNLWSVLGNMVTPPSVQPSGNPGDELWNITEAIYDVGRNIPDDGQGLDFIYLVTTADVRMQLILVRGKVGEPLDYTLDFETMTLAPTPEPSTLVLAALALVGLTIAAWRRRR